MKSKEIVEEEEEEEEEQKKKKKRREEVEEDNEDNEDSDDDDKGMKTHFIIIRHCMMLLCSLKIGTINQSVHQIGSQP